MKLVEETQNDLSGIALLRDWLGDGGAVHPMLAEFRAQTCTIGNGGNACPHNKEANWWERNIKMPVARVIKEELELKSGMNLSAKGEDAVHMCAACGCCLKLKIWTPIQHIRNHLSAKQLVKTPSYCWMRREIERTNG